MKKRSLYDYIFGELFDSSESVVGRSIRDLKDVVRPEDIEIIVNLVLKKYDRSKVFRSEIREKVTPVYDLFTVPFTALSESRKLSITTRDGFKIWTPLRRGLNSRIYRLELEIGTNIPHEYTEVGEVFKAVFQEKKEDTLKYLLIKYIRGPEKFKHVMLLETNDKEYAASHSNLGFKVD